MSANRRRQSSSERIRELVPIPMDRDFNLSDPETVVKCMLQLEAAHWHYLDEIRPVHSELPHLSLQSFAMLYLPRLENHEFAEIMRLFNRYKKSLPIYGSILLSPDFEQVLLVKNINSDSWSFPKGKQEWGETDEETVVRETLEETNINISNRINKSHQLRHRRANFFIIEDVALCTLAVPWKRAEISEVSWFPVSALDDRPIFNIYIRHLAHKLQLWIANRTASSTVAE